MTEQRIAQKFELVRQTVTEALSSRDDEFRTGLKAASAICDLMDELEQITLATLQSLVSVFEAQTAHTDSIRMLTAMIKEVAKSSAGDKRQIADLESKLVSIMDDKLN